jgi:hypothetical protein
MVLQDHCCYGIRATFLIVLVIFALSRPALYAQTGWQPSKNGQYIILAEQSKSRVAIAEVKTGSIVWEWQPAVQSDILPEHVKWFGNMSDAKPVKKGKYILACASGGGVALIRIADKKTVWYAYAGGNTHSVELLPDGNIVSASSTGNFMRIFVYNEKDKPEEIRHKDLYLHDGHNLVWDKKRQFMYTVSGDQFKTYRYDHQKEHPGLIAVDSVTIPGKGAHDLYWSFDHRFLWSSTSAAIFRIHIPGNKKVEKVEGKITSNIKSVSGGSAAYPVIVVQPKESWWTDEVLDINGNSMFKQEGLRIYKARWLL